MKRILFSVMVLLALGMAAPVAAAPIVGSLGFHGAGVLTFSTAGGAPGSNFIDWCPLNAGSPGAPGAIGCANPLVDPTLGVSGFGRMDVGSVTGDFVGDVFGVGKILDMTDNPAAPPYTYVPVATPIAVAGFFDFPDPYTYTLTYLHLATGCGPADVCVGAFKITDAPGDNVTVAISGQVVISAPGREPTLFDMTISAQFAGATPAEFVTMAASGTGAFSSSVSGELRAAAVPEPASLFLFGTGSALLGLHRRRKARKR